MAVEPKRRGAGLWNPVLESSILSDRPFVVEVTLVAPRSSKLAGCRPLKSEMEDRRLPSEPVVCCSFFASFAVLCDFARTIN